MMPGAIPGKKFQRADICAACASASFSRAILISRFRAPASRSAAGKSIELPSAGGASAARATLTTQKTKSARHRTGFMGH